MNDVLDAQVVVDVECLDRIYLNGWVPTLQVPGQVVGFLTRHLGFPIPSPAILEKMGLRFCRALTKFARAKAILVVGFAKGERKLEVMVPHLDRLTCEGRVGVASIGVAQEFQRVFTGTTHQPDAEGGGLPRFGCAKSDRRVIAYYFYVLDETLRPGEVAGLDEAQRRLPHARLTQTETSVATEFDLAGVRYKGSQRPL